MKIKTASSIKSQQIRRLLKPSRIRKAPSSKQISNVERRLKQLYPAVWATIKAKRPDLFSKEKLTLSSLGQEAPKETWIDKILQIGTGLIAIKRDQDVFKENMRRAQQNLPPVEVPRDPAVTVAVELPPEIKAEVARTAQTARQTLPLTLLGGGLLVMMMLRRRR